MNYNIKRRFFFSIFGNFVRGIFTFFSGLLLARFIGPMSYGDMTYLVSIFVAIISLLDMGTSSAFLTFLSQKPKPVIFVNIYLTYQITIFITALLVILLIFPYQWLINVFYTSIKTTIFLGFLAVFFQFGIWNSFVKIGESQRLSLFIQYIFAGITLAQLAFIIIIWKLNYLSLNSIFLIYIFSFSIGSIILSKKIKYQENDSRVKIKQTIKEIYRIFFNYCKPLFLYTIVAFIYQFIDRWMLQKYGGSLQQAYYSIGIQFGSIIILATTSILNIFWKEIAEAQFAKDYETVIKLYSTFTKVLFFMGSAIAGYFIPWSKETLTLLFGEKYLTGSLTFGLMMIAPIYQSLGQISNTMLMASNYVKVTVYVNYVFIGFSIILTYLLLAPRTLTVPGLGLGSLGLAIKIILMQIIQVNALMLIISKLWNFPFKWSFQFIVFLGCLCLGETSYIIINYLFNNHLTGLQLIILSGIMYSILIIVFANYTPNFVGFEVRNIFNILRIQLYKYLC